MKYSKFLLTFPLILITICIYWQTGTHGFYAYDDVGYVAINDMVLKGITAEGVAWTFSSFYAANWHPVTWLSHMLDIQLFGINASGHHLVNVFFHVLNTSLVFLVLFKLTSALWRSFAVALLFAIHPLHVESVAWVAERKDLLSGLFFLLSLLVWESYTRKQTIIRYVCTLLLFTLGLMSKPMLVTLPFILLLLDWWPLGRFDTHKPAWLFTEKIPFFLLAACSSVVTYIAQNQGGAVVSFNNSPLTYRLANAVISYGVYLRKMVWPNDLVVFYPFLNSIHWLPLAAWGVSFVVASITFFRIRKQYPYVMVGWLWYLGMLFPVIGVIRVGAQAMADRYTYLPLLGPFIMIIWGTAEAATRPARKVVIVASAAIVMTVLSFLAWQQVGYWKSDIILFSRVLKYSPVTSEILADLSRAYLEKGEELKDQYKLDEALKYFDIVSARSVGVIAAAAHNNIGHIMAMQGKETEAIREYEISIRHDATFAGPYYNLGLLYLNKGLRKEAAACFNEVIRLDSENKDARKYLDGIAQYKLR